MPLCIILSQQSSSMWAEFSYLTYMLPARVKQGDIVFLCQLPYPSEYLFPGTLVVFSTFLLETMLFVKLKYYTVAGKPSFQRLWWGALKLCKQWIQCCWRQKCTQARHQEVWAHRDLRSVCNKSCEEFMDKNDHRQWARGCTEEKETSQMQDLTNKTIKQRMWISSGRYWTVIYSHYCEQITSVKRLES